MDRLTENRIVLVTRRTRLEDLITRFNTEAQAKFYVEHLGADFSDYKTEHETYQLARERCESSLSRVGKLSAVERLFLPNYLFRPDDTVVVLGQDGVVANTLKYLTGQPCVGVNPDPDRWDGVLVPFGTGDVRETVLRVFADRQPVRRVTFGQVELNTGERLLAVNDFFIGPSSHISARYDISYRGKSERQSSSGLIVSTGLGSTGWFKSIVQGALGVSRALSGKGKTKGGGKGKGKGKGNGTSGGGEENQMATTLAWEAPKLYFTVREPFPSRSSEANIIFGEITPQQPLVLVSEMAGTGVIFSDGIEKDFLAFNHGTRATISVLPERGVLAVP